MNRLSHDNIWSIISWLPIDRIIPSSIVCRQWMFVIHNRTQEEWRRIYHRHVCDWLCVGAMFDWKRAVGWSGRHDTTLIALCVWNNLYVCIAVPWDENASLRDGIIRLVRPHSVDFVYRDTFRLRGLAQSCLLQGSVIPCRNCKSKQGCLNLRYKYYLTTLTQDVTTLNECLSHYLVPYDSERKNRCDRNSENGRARRISYNNGIREGPQVCWVDDN